MGIATYKLSEVKILSSFIKRAKIISDFFFCFSSLNFLSPNENSYLADTQIKIVQNIDCVKRKKNSFFSRGGVFIIY